MENNINEEKEEIKKCQNIGCNKEYKESENKENVCLYHSGAPIFHEGQKGYTCCSKVNFKKKNLIFNNIFEREF